MRLPVSIRVAVAIGLVAVVAVAVLGWRLLSTPPPVTGTQLDQAVPDISLIDQHGDSVSLSSEQGKIVVIYPFLTACHELCPMTTAAFIQISEAIHAAGLQDKVALWEVTVDPQRDTPERLAAYADLVSADWTLLTGTQVNLDRFWKFFGVTHEQQPVASPVPVDWYTHQPETYDVNHTPVLLFIDGSGHERIVLVGTADLGGKLAPSLKAMLNDTGLNNLAHPDAPWTVRQALDNIGALLGRTIPLASGS